MIRKTLSLGAVLLLAAAAPAGAGIGGSPERRGGDCFGEREPAASAA